MVFTDLFFFPSSSEYSLKGAIELLSHVARHGEESGFGMPCLLIAAQNDLDSSSTANKDSAKVLGCFFDPTLFTFETHIKGYELLLWSQHAEKLNNRKS